MKSHTASYHHDHNAADIVTMKQEIESIKTYYSTKADLISIKADLIRWMVGVGAASAFSVIGVLGVLDARVTHLDTRLTQEIREVRKEAREERQEMRKERREDQQATQQALAELSRKIDTLRR